MILWAIWIDQFSKLLRGSQQGFQQGVWSSTLRKLLRKPLCKQLNSSRRETAVDATPRIHLKLRSEYPSRPLVAELRTMSVESFQLINQFSWRRGKATIASEGIGSNSEKTMPWESSPRVKFSTFSRHTFYLGYKSWTFRCSGKAT